MQTLKRVKMVLLDIKSIVVLFIAMLLGANLLPDALASWYAATGVGGSLATAPTGFKAIWNFVPYGVALAVFAMVVVIGINKFGKGTSLDIKSIVMLFIAMLLGANLLPEALNSWYDATAVGGALASAPAGFIAIWNFVPYGVALAVFAMVVVIGLNKFGNKE